LLLHDYRIEMMITKGEVIGNSARSESHGFLATGPFFASGGSLVERCPELVEG
jgi:hypothetical protein